MDSADAGEDGNQTDGDMDVGDDGAVAGDGEADGGVDAADEIPVGVLRVEMGGQDSGDCRASPCRTLAYAGQQMNPGELLLVGDGTYDEGVETGTFPSGAPGSFTTIRAVNDGRAEITGGLALYRNGDFYLQFEGLRLNSPTSKGVAGGNVRFYRTSFAGGPARGNTVNLGIGTNDFQPGAWGILCEDCLFYGLGGRYSLLVYRSRDVVLRRAVARKDGGWGLNGSDDTEWEPEGVIVFYESSDSVCEQCVVFDSLKLSHQSAEALGALIQNSHSDTLHDNVEVREGIVVNNAYSGLALEGNGAVHNARYHDTYSVANQLNGVTLNLDSASVEFTRCAVIGNGGDGIADYGSASVSLVDSVVRDNQGEQLRNVSGETTGSGPGAIDLSSFNSERIRSEFCAGVQRGFCATASTFQEYLQTYINR